jgi:hypothetical protein
MHVLARAARSKVQGDAEHGDWGASHPGLPAEDRAVWGFVLAGWGQNARVCVRKSMLYGASCI